MLFRFAIFPFVLLFGVSMCHKGTAVVSGPPASANPPGAAAPTVPSRPASDVSAGRVSTTPTAPTGSSAKTATTRSGKVVVDQTAQTIIFCYHGLVDKVRFPGTQITPAAFEAQMKELKDRGISVISLQDLLAWRRSEKAIPPRCAVITFDDGLKSQYDVAWPMMKKFGYTFTMFVYTEGVRGGLFGGGEAITWEMLGDMRDNGIDIEAHSATHQDLRENHPVTIREPGGKKMRKRLTGAEYAQFLQNELVGCKTLLEQRLAIKVNCFAVPYGFYNEHVKEIARNVGYEAMFTVYGQPITWTSPMDALGRYAIEANKPKTFEDAVKTIAASTGGPGAAPVAAVGSENLQTEPANGETVRTAIPLIKANLSGFGTIDPSSIQMRISGLGVVLHSYDPKTGTVSYQVTQKLRDKTCTVILSAKSEGKKVETHWTFGIDDGSAGAPAAAPSATPKR
jgi:peptidoglycan/xylan/chitin deacetylase (PgdA/CDA1 family)